MDFQTATIMEPFRKFHKDRVTTKNNIGNNIVAVDDQTYVYNLILLAVLGTLWCFKGS